MLGADGKIYQWGVYEKKGEICLTLKQRNTTFDLLKGIACLAVVFIHYSFTGALEIIGVGINAMCRFAVPIFFGISGYYLSSTSYISDESVLRKIRHILKMILVSAVFYAVFFLWWNPVYNRGFDLAAYLAEKLTAGRIAKLFLSNDPLVYSHLWYMLALVYCYVTVLFFFRNGKNSKFFYILTPFLMLGMMLFQEFSGVFHIKSGIKLPESTQTVYFFNLYVFRALPFFVFGSFCRMHQEKIRKLRGGIWLWVALAAVGCVAASVERILLNRSCQFFLGSYLTFFSLMILAIKFPALHLPFFCYAGKNLSVYVYILHIAVGKAYDIVAAKFNLWGKLPYVATRPIVVMAGSLLAAFLVHSCVTWCSRYLKERKEKAHIA